MIGYLSGPITGNLNYMQQFDRAASELAQAMARSVVTTGARVTIKLLPVHGRRPTR